MFRFLTSQLSQYDEHEARSVVRLMLLDGLGLTYTDICAGALEHLDITQQQRLNEMMQRLCKGEPVQYVTGKTNFCERTFCVRRGCLIPRPETEELCCWIIRDTAPTANILDIGTGSGCIAVTLKKEIPNASVTAWDVSPQALSIAQENANLNDADITFKLQDALTPPNESELFDVVVSNPPYICKKESCDMDKNVLDYEPHNALFVPDDDPLLFYRHITQYAANALRDSGHLYFEINPEYSNNVSDLLHANGFCNVTIKTDDFGKERMIKGTKTNQKQRHIQ